MIVTYFVLMENKSKIRYFRKKLLDWFDINKRDFPWRREDISNYELIMSEILLQRTKAETVSRYYNTFFGKYPNWGKISTANLEELEDILRPLGLYKHRAKRLFNIIKEYNDKNGNLPQKSNELNESALATLYISNAYELFILKKRAPLLDVNMARVISRFFNPKKVKDVRNDKELQEFAKKVINIKDCKELNWAILDFAAIVCKSSKPNCNNCPLNEKCRFYAEEIKQTDVEEPQLNIYYGKKDGDLKKGKKYRHLSLFSGCGGMDLGFEGDFLVHEKSINVKYNPDFIEKKEKGNLIRLSPTKFQTVFANDIIIDARKAWVNYFKDKGYSSEIFHVESIVDLVKLHKQGVKVFPDKIDVVTGGFPCQDFSVSGLRNGFNSHKDHTGKKINESNLSVETRGQLYMWMKEVIDLGVYSLQEEYEDLFTIGNENLEETIFEIEYLSGNVGEGNDFTSVFAPENFDMAIFPDNRPGSGRIVVTPDMAESYEEGDLRRIATIEDSLLLQDGSYDQVKYGVKFIDFQAITGGDGGINFTALRYADVLLMYAEALNQLDDTETALQYLNMVRDRAGLDPLTGLNKAEFELAMEQERRVEFVQEAHRWFDLVRTNRLQTVMNNYFQENGWAFTVEDHEVLLPIPQDEIDINPTLEQNTGY